MVIDGRCEAIVYQQTARVRPRRMAAALNCCWPAQ